jgi:hypothetical protein
VVGDGVVVVVAADWSRPDVLMSRSTPGMVPAAGLIAVRHADSLSASEDADPMPAKGMDAQRTQAPGSP